MDIAEGSTRRNTFRFGLLMHALITLPCAALAGSGMCQPADRATAEGHGNGSVSSWALPAETANSNQM